MQDNIERSRYELVTGDGIVFANYRRDEGHVLLTHVEAPVHLRGKGLASQLLQDIANAARDNGQKITPGCSYAAHWFRRHRDFSDVLA